MFLIMSNGSETEREIWSMPVWASEVIMETLGLDIDSKSIDSDIREDIEEAVNEIETRRQHEIIDCLEPGHYFLCSWDSNGIGEIHTKKSLKENYSETNLFDESGDDWTISHEDGILEERSVIQVMDYLIENEWLYKPHWNDNMMIMYIGEREEEKGQLFGELPPHLHDTPLHDEVEQQLSRGLYVDLNDGAVNNPMMSIALYNLYDFFDEETGQPIERPEMPPALKAIQDGLRGKLPSE